MIEEGLLLPMNVLLQGQKLTLLDPEMWFLRGNENKDVTLVITIGNNHQKLMVVEDILLLIDRSQIEVTAGKVIYHPLRIDILSKLLAFIDESTGSVEGNAMSCLLMPCPLHQKLCYSVKLQVKPGF